MVKAVLKTTFIQCLLKKKTYYEQNRRKVCTKSYGPKEIRLWFKAAGPPSRMTSSSPLVTMVVSARREYRPMCKFFSLFFMLLFLSFNVSGFVSLREGRLEVHQVLLQTTELRLRATKDYGGQMCVPSLQGPVFGDVAKLCRALTCTLSMGFTWVGKCGRAAWWPSI